MRVKLMVLFIFVFGWVSAQKASLSGVVSDIDYNNEGLPAVSVFIKGTTIGTTTDINGKYTLEVNPELI